VQQTHGVCVICADGIIYQLHKLYSTFVPADRITDGLLNIVSSVYLYSAAVRADVFQIRKQHKAPDVGGHAIRHIMRTKLLLLTFICFACNEQNTKGDPDTKSQSINMDTGLIGVWKSDVNDQATKNSIGNVTMTFTKDGNLIYDIHEGDKLQRMNMIYRISGDTLISDQPSHPQEQRTKYKFENNDKLILEFEGMSTVFRRETK
jgi:hypothetical protein